MSQYGIVEDFACCGLLALPLVVAIYFGIRAWMIDRSASDGIAPDEEQSFSIHQCPDCRAEVDTGARFCGRCGQRLH